MFVFFFLTVGVKIMKAMKNKLKITVRGRLGIIFCHFCII